MISCDLALTGNLLLPEGSQRCDDGLVLVDEGVIRYAGPRLGAPPFGAAQELSGDVIAPGLVDIHVHGGGGVDVVDGGADTLARVGGAHLRRGTTAYVPTVLAAAPEETCRALETIRDASKAHSTDMIEAPSFDASASRVLGAHLEGPFLNPSRAGAQPLDHLRAPDLGLLEELLAAAGGTLKMATLAPELPGALDLIARLSSDGVTVSMGHSAATYDEALAAVDAGARHATHLWNAMSPLHHREPGLVGLALTDPRVTVEVIADGVHLHPSAVALAWRAKGPGGLALVTDCIGALDAGEGGARLGDQPVVVDSEGAARLPDGTLAGSLLTMDRAAAGLCAMSGATSAEALAAASAAPAAVIGAGGSVGSIRQGGAADLVVTNSSLVLVAVIKDGAVVPRSQEAS